MTNGLVLLLAWVEFALLVGILAFWVLREQNRNPLAEAEVGTTLGAPPSNGADRTRQRQIEPALSPRSRAAPRRFPSGEGGNESRVDSRNRGEDSGDGTEGT